MVRRAALICLALLLTAGLFAVGLTAAVDGNRVDAATVESIQLLDLWLGPSSSPPSSFAPATVTTPWWDADGLMTVESQVAYYLALDRFAHLPREGTAPIAESIAWYLQTRIIERLFDFRYLSAGYSSEALCLFGCHVRWDVASLRLGRASAGLGRVEYLRASTGRAWPATARTLPNGFRPGTFQGALAFATLERELGWPMLQGALRVVAAGHGSEPIARTIGDAVGRDLQPFFATAFDPATVADLRLQSVSSSPVTNCAAPCYLTRIEVERTGPMRVPAVKIRVEFEGGRQLEWMWDPAETPRTFEFESATPAVEVLVDPDRVWLLDRNYVDDQFSARRRSNVPIGKWVAQWLVWLQNAMLAATFPV